MTIVNHVSRARSEQVGARAPRLCFNRVVVSRFQNLLTFPDRIRYLAWRLSGAHSVFRCRFRNGPRISIRPTPSEDYSTAYDMFRLGIYDTDLEPDSVNYVVDLGGNVGYTCLLWCWRYPRARVLTFEPNPKHSEILNWHVQVNHYSKRVAVIAAGASSHDGSAAFVDADVWSRVVSEGEPKPPNSLTIKLVDFFAAIGNDPIDILKIDIEGGEYDIMNDVRFDAVARRCRIIIMEWHQFDPSQPGGAWCTAKLESLGFGVQQTNAAGNIGLLVARKLKSADFPQTNGTPHKV